MIAFLFRMSAGALVLAAVAVIALSGCAQTAPTAYRDVTGQGRDVAALEMDTAQCRYEFEQARAGGSQFVFGRRPVDYLGSAMVSSTPRALYDACVEAKGWGEVR